MRNRLKKREGFALVTVLLSLIVISILGVSIIGVTSSTYKMTKIDSKSQASFYIAEAGINKAIADIKQEVDLLSEKPLKSNMFFENLNIFINENINNTIFDKFEPSFNANPTATLNIIQENVSGESDPSSTQVIVTYVINSKGTVDKTSRTLSASIDVSHDVKTDNSTEHQPAFDYVIYSPEGLSLPHNSKIDGSIYSRNIELKSAGTQISGDVISETFIDISGNSTHPKVGGDLYALDGYIKVASGGGKATVKGDVNANGNVILGSEGRVEKSVYSLGNILLEPANAEILGDAHAQGNVTLSSGTSIGGNTYLNKDLELLNSNSKVVGDVFAGNNIFKENNTNIKGNSQAGGSINQHNQTKKNINIAIDNKPTNPRFPVSNTIEQPKLSSFSSNKNKPISVPRGSSNYIIEPGTYGDLYVDGASTIVFKNGTYIFNSIDGARWGQKIRLDLSQGPISIFSVGDIKYSGKFEVTEDGKNWLEIDDLEDKTAVRLASKVYWETLDNFILTSAVYPSQWFGSVLANKNIDLEPKVKLIGAYVTNKGKFQIASSPEIIYAPPGGSANVESGETQTEEGTNSISPEKRVKISSSIREK